MPSETVHLDGHIIDSQTLSRVLDLILLHGGEYEITSFQIGTRREEPSHAEIVVRATDAAALQQILQEVGQHGATSPAHEAESVPAPADGVFPADFYSTTNLESFVRVEGAWLPIERIEMDCGVVLERARRRAARALHADAPRARRRAACSSDELAVKVVPAPAQGPRARVRLHVERGVGRASQGADGRRRRPRHGRHAPRGPQDPVRRRPGHHPHRRRRLPGTADRRRLDRRAVRRQRARHARHRVGAARHVARRAVSTTGAPMASGHNHHLRAINTHPRRRRHPPGGRAAACSRAASCTRASRTASTTCSPAASATMGRCRTSSPTSSAPRTRCARAGRGRRASPSWSRRRCTRSRPGNLLPASVQIICVDNNMETITKLMDRGTHQAFGLVTDCQFFLKELAARTASARA